MQKKDNLTFKMLYVIAIIMIVDGHIGSFDYLNLNNLLRYQNYHIALFMFTSGYFLNLNRSMPDFFKRKISRIIIPLYVWNLIYGLITGYLNHYQNFAIGGTLNLKNLLLAPLTDGHQYIYNMGSWFLIPLFFVQTIGYLILKPTVKANKEVPAYCYILFFIMSLVLGCIALHFGPDNHGERGLTLLILRTFYFLPAFAFGMVYHHFLEKYDTVNTPLYFTVVLGLTAILCHFFPGYNHIPSWLDHIYAPGMVIYAISFLAILFWLRIAKIFTPIIKKSFSLQYISDHTFDIMMHHFAGFMLIKALFITFNDFNTTAFKTNIWYYYYPIEEDFFAWVYILGGIAISLAIGTFSRYITHTLKTKKW